MPNIRDVARRANVSVATVSNVLNAPCRVSPALTVRITQAIQDLGYSPNPAARSLRKGSSNLLGLIVADITNPFFTELVHVVEEAASSQGYSVLLCNSDEQVGREEQHLRVLRAQRVDGLIIAPTGRPSRSFARLLHALPCPVVLVDRALDELSFDTVSLDNRAAAAAAVGHVLDLGHRAVGFINGSERIKTAADRLTGYREAMLARGIPVDFSLIRKAAFKESEAFEAAVSLLGSDDPPTAVFAANGLMTMGLLRGMATLGLRCPDQVSIIGMDDVPWAEAFNPTLTMIAQPLAVMGKAAVRMLLERILGVRTDGPEHFVAQPSLIVRQSCGRVYTGEQVIHAQAVSCHAIEDPGV
jgi:LacI family transcriptional regulator